MFKLHRVKNDSYGAVEVDISKDQSLSTSSDCEWPALNSSLLWVCLLHVGCWLQPTMTDHIEPYWSCDVM